jgi:hypothetical protein
MSTPASKAAAAVPLKRHKLHKGRRQVPGADPRVDTLIGMVMALTSEVSILRDRLDAHERLAAAGQAPSPNNVDDFVPDEIAQRERAQRRQHLIDKVCRPMVAAEAAALEPRAEDAAD